MASWRVISYDPGEEEYENDEEKYFTFPYFPGYNQDKLWDILEEFNDDFEGKFWFAIKTCNRVKGCIIKISVREYEYVDSELWARVKTALDYFFRGVLARD
jgi:hypothetical protein